MFLTWNHNCDSTGLDARMRMERSSGGGRLTEYKMTYFIFARDGTSHIILRRDSREAAEKKASELRSLGWFDVEVKEEKQEGSPKAA
jgi:hypothetical protein